MDFDIHGNHTSFNIKWSELTTGEVNKVKANTPVVGKLSEAGTDLDTQTKQQEEVHIVCGLCGGSGNTEEVCKVTTYYSSGGEVI